MKNPKVSIPDGSRFGSEPSVQRDNRRLDMSRVMTWGLWACEIGKVRMGGGTEGDGKCVEGIGVVVASLRSRSS